MTQEEFVKSIKIIAIENVAKAVCSQLANPAGRSPSEKIKQMSAIFNLLSDEQQILINDVAVMAADLSVYSLLGIVDGTIQIEDAGPKGEIKLFFEKNGESILLNNPNEEELTSIFKTI
jgi:hypothetical protein